MAIAATPGPPFSASEVGASSSQLCFSGSDMAI
jgi:hypothetical protein